MKPCLRVSCLMVVLPVWVGCGGSHPPVAPPEPPVVTVAKPVERTLDNLAEFTGRLAARETQEVRAQVTGYLMEIRFKDGDEVSENDVLYVIDSTQYVAAWENAVAMVKKLATDVTSAEAQLDLADKENKRMIASGTSASKSEVDKAAATFKTAQTTLEGVKASLESAKATEKKALFDKDNCFIKSSVKGKGRVSRTEITKGNLVQAGQTLLCTVTSQSPIYVYYDVDEDTSLKYRRMVFDKKEIKNPRDPGIESKLKIWVGLKDSVRGPDGKWPRTGYVDYIAPEIVRGLGTREIRGVIDNPDGRLTPGDSVRVQVEAGLNEKVIVVPEIAVGSQQQQKFVYVVVEKEGKKIVEFRPIELGPVRELDGVRWQIIRNGVTTKDTIIVNGLLRVRPGIEVKPVEQSAGK